MSDLERSEAMREKMDRSRRLLIITILASLIGFYAPGNRPAHAAQSQEIIEYYIYYRPGLAEQIHEERYEHPYATYEEAEAARQQAARDANDVENFLNMTYIKEVHTGRFANPTPQTVPQSSATSGTSDAASNSSAAARAEREAKEQRIFEEGKAELLRNMQGGNAEGLEIRTSTGVELRMKGELPVSAAVSREQKAFEQNNPAWRQSYVPLVQKMHAGPSPQCAEICESIRTKKPPFPSYRQFNELKSGDVLIFEPDDKVGATIKYLDRLASWDLHSPVSHALTYLKEVNGKKLFLDNTSGRGMGPRIITEDEFLRIYGKREAYVAQPLNTIDSGKLWAAARELVLKQTTGSHGFVDRSHYGVWGKNDMVCSEAARWVLVKAGADIRQTGSLAKRAIGIKFSPADIWLDDQDFLITPFEFPKR
jgi:hypothetical protein